MNTEGETSAAANVLAAILIIPDELDRQTHEVAFAYVAQAINVIKQQMGADSGSSD